MTDEWVLIVGGSGDIAQAIAEGYARSGKCLILASRNQQKLIQQASRLEQQYAVKVKVMSFDISDFSAFQDFVYGLPERLSGVVFAQGAMMSPDLANHAMQTNNMLVVNYNGVVLLTELLLSKNLSDRLEFLTFIGSVAGDRGRPSNYIYGSTKAALETYVQGLSGRLLKTGIQVRLIKPGFVETKMTQGMKLPKLLTARPEEVADAAINVNKNVIYVRPVWRYIMIIIRCLPRRLIRRL